MHRLLDKYIDYVVVSWMMHVCALDYPANKNMFKENISNVPVKLL